MPSLANQYAAEDVISSTSGTATFGAAFGFVATRIRVYNDKVTPVYVSLNSTAGSSGGHRTCAGELLSIEGVASGGIGVASTTTSTGTIVRIAAWG